MPISQNIISFDHIITKLKMFLYLWSAEITPASIQLNILIFMEVDCVFQCARHRVAGKNGCGWLVWTESVLMTSPSMHFSEGPLMNFVYSRTCFIQVGLTVWKTCWSKKKKVCVFPCPYCSSLKTDIWKCLEHPNGKHHTIQIQQRYSNPTKGCTPCRLINETTTYHPF